MHYIADVFDKNQTISQAFSLQVRDNLPIVSEGKYGARRRATCDFCKKSHLSNVEHCPLEVMGLDTDKPEIASKVLL